MHHIKESVMFMVYRIVLAAIEIERAPVNDIPSTQNEAVSHIQAAIVMPIIAEKTLSLSFLR
jgi:hypothetical protein